MLHLAAPKCSLLPQALLFKTQSDLTQVAARAGSDGAPAVQDAVQVPLFATGRAQDQLAPVTAGGWSLQAVTSGTTLTVKDVVAVAPPSADLATHVTVLAPMGKTEPLGGWQVTLGGVAVPSVAPGSGHVAVALLVEVLTLTSGGVLLNDGTGAAGPRLREAGWRQHA